MRPSLTATYTKRLADASAEANAEKYHTEVDHAGVQRADALNAPVNITHVAKHKKLAKEEFAGRKQELEGDLFTLFEKKDHWSTKDVQVRRSHWLTQCVACDALARNGDAIVNRTFARVNDTPSRGSVCHLCLCTRTPHCCLWCHPRSCSARLVSPTLTPRSC